MAFPDFPRPQGLRRLLVPRLPQNQNGFQAAHIVGSNFWLNSAQWLEELSFEEFRGHDTKCSQGATADKLLAWQVCPAS